MANIKPVEEATEDFTADLAALRDDVAKLSSSVSDFIRSQTAATTNTVADAVDNARQKIYLFKNDDVVFPQIEDRGIAQNVHIGGRTVQQHILLGVAQSFPRPKNIRFRLPHDV